MTEQPRPKTCIAANGTTNRRRVFFWAMRENLRPGEKFPDIELPNQNEERTRLSSLMRGFPTAVVFSRGYY
jgi:hypothetical protein